MAAPHSVKKAELKPKHRRNLRKYATLLHGLGVNVSEHVEKLEMDENELKEIRAGLVKETFLKPADKTYLKQILARLYNIMRTTVALEETLWNDAAPPVFSAINVMSFSPELIALRAMRELSTIIYQKAAVRLKTDIPKAHMLVLASFTKEHQTLFIIYPKLLLSIEKAISELLDIEERYDRTEHSLKKRFSELNKELRKLLHEDIHFLTKDIAKIYDMRIRVFNWLIEADSEVTPHILKKASQEKEQILNARNFYLLHYKEHLERISNLYTRPIGGAK